MAPKRTSKEEVQSPAVASAAASVPSGSAPAKRKRITPTLINPADGADEKAMPTVGTAPKFAPHAAAEPAADLLPEGAAASEPAADGGEELWATDPQEVSDVRVRRVGAHTTVCCSERGEGGEANAPPQWEHPVLSGVDELAVDNNYVAIASGQELHILSLETGRLVFPPILLSSRVLCLELERDGDLVVLLRDGSLLAWDVKKANCIARATLRNICRPTDVDLIGLRPGVLEPVVRLFDGRTLLFHKELQNWVSMSSPSEPSARPPDECSVQPAVSNREGAIADGPRLEGDLLAASYLGVDDEIKARLRWMIQHFARQGDHARVRSWCTALLGRAPASGAFACGMSVHRELTALGLKGTELIKTVVLPALTQTLGSQELHAEIEASCLDSSEEKQLF